MGGGAVASAAGSYHTVEHGMLLREKQGAVSAIQPACDPLSRVALGGLEALRRHNHQFACCYTQRSPVALDGLEALRRLDLPVNDEALHAAAHCRDLPLRMCAQHKSMKEP